MITWQALLPKSDAISIGMGLSPDICCNCRELHEAHSTVPLPIREYIKEVQAHLECLTSHSGPETSLADKLTFLRETRHAFGRTALVLSGGGALGAFHVVHP